MPEPSTIPCPICARDIAEDEQMVTGEMIANGARALADRGLAYDEAYHDARIVLRAVLATRVAP